MSIKGYCKTRPHRSYCFLSVFKLRCKRHYRNLATYSWCTTWREHVTKTAPARRRHSVGGGGGGGAPISYDRRRRRQQNVGGGGGAAAAAHSSTRNTQHRPIVRDRWRSLWMSSITYINDSYTVYYQVVPLPVWLYCLLISLDGFCVVCFIAITEHWFPCFNTTFYVGVCRP